jgi:hypothetical protein
MTTNDRGAVEIFHNCRLCRRPLKTRKAKLIGYGPVCKRKLDKLEQQITIDEVLANGDEQNRIQV